MVTHVRVLIDGEDNTIPVVDFVDYSIVERTKLIVQNKVKFLNGQEEVPIMDGVKFISTIHK